MLKDFIKDSEITFIIILVNVIIFVLETLAWWSTNTNVAINFWAFATPLFLAQPRRIITACFLHFWIAHLVMNMYALYSIWPAIERNFWKRKYLLIYLVSWICWNLMVFAIESLTWSYSLSAWASWAIFWLLWTFLALYISIPKEIRDRVNWKNIISSIVFCLLPWFLPWISMSAHLWGLIWWFIISYILILAKKPSTNSDY